MISAGVALASSSRPAIVEEKMRTPFVLGNYNARYDKTFQRRHACIQKRGLVCATKS
jgi:hypothetical protein